MAYTDQLTSRQISALRRSIELGRTLQKERPQISRLYQNHSYSQIIDMLDIQTKYDVEYEIARGGVRFAIMGHSGGLRIKAYTGLISKKERKKIEIKHRIQGGNDLYEEGRGIHEQTIEERRELGREGGNKSLRERKGYHALTKEQMSENGRRYGFMGGLIGGNKAYEEGVGVHQRTSEQHSEDGSIGGKNSAIERGQKPWSDKERKYAYRLSLKTEYTHRQIAIALNLKFHHHRKTRTTIAVSRMLGKHRGLLEDMLERI